MQWEFNSATNIRFGRLNLVDLAGSERYDLFSSRGKDLFDHDEKIFLILMPAQAENFWGRGRTVEGGR